MPAVQGRTNAARTHDVFANSGVQAAIIHNASRMQAAAKDKEEEEAAEEEAVTLRADVQ